MDRRKITRNTDGALMVMAVFVALFMVAIVYHVAGVGGAALEQQTMQDAADAMTFSAATAKARGMNLLAMINLIMAAAVAVLVALRLLMVVIAILIIICIPLCYFGGSTCALIPKLIDFEIQVNNWANDVEDIVQPLTRALAKAADVVNQAVPILAQAEAIHISTRDIYNPAKIGFVWPLVEELPTKEGPFELLCAKAAKNVADVVTFLLPPIIPDAVMDKFGDGLAGLATSFSSFFCGTSDSNELGSRTEEVAYPGNDHREECTAESALPDPGTGECGNEQCKKCSRWGCAACLNAQERDGYQRGQWTRSRKIWVEWTTSSGQLKKKIEDEEDKRLVTLKEDPCDGTGSCGGEICTDEVIDLVDEPQYPDNARRVTQTTYHDLHNCIIEEELEMNIEMEQANEDDWGRPRILDEEQFPEGARLRGVVLGRRDAKNDLYFLKAYA